MGGDAEKDGAEEAGEEEGGDEAGEEAEGVELESPARRLRSPWAGAAKEVVVVVVVMIVVMLMMVIPVEPVMTLVSRVVSTRSLKSTDQLLAKAMSGS